MQEHLEQNKSMYSCTWNIEIAAVKRVKRSGKINILTIENENRCGKRAKRSG